MWLQINLCRIQRSFGDESSSMDQEDPLDIRFYFPTGRSTGTHDKDCARLVKRLHKLVAQRLLAPTVTRFEPTRVQLVEAHIGKGL